MSNAVAENLPDAQGHFGPYGGRYVPETLMHPLQELDETGRNGSRSERSRRRRSQREDWG